MNKELYIKNANKEKELKELYYILRNLQSFLKDNENNFKREKSILALKRIKEYLEKKENEYKLLENEQKNIEKELYHTCNHEIAIKYSNIPTYQCLICKNNLDKDRNIIKEKALISIDTTNDYKVAYIIEEVFKEVIYSDKDLIDTINDLIEELQYERNIKFYRRTK